MISQNILGDIVETVNITLATKIADFELNKLTRKSKLTDEDVQELNELIKHSVAKRMGTI